MITGVLNPDEGEILINGKNIVTQPLEAKKEFGIVPDNAAVSYTQLHRCVFLACRYSQSTAKPDGFPDCGTHCRHMAYLNVVWIHNL